MSPEFRSEKYKVSQYNFIYPTVTSARSCNKVGHLFWFTILAQHETNDVILYVHSVHKHRGNSFQRKNYKMRLKQRSLNWINSMQVIKILFTNVFFSWSLCLLNMFPSMPSWYSPSICIFPVCWHNRHHSSWPFLECRPSKLYFKNLNTLKIWWLIIQIPPFSRKWPILPRKYMQVLSISSDWERQGPWAVWYIQFCNSV